MHVRGQDLKEGMVLLKYLEERSYAHRAEQPNALILPSQQTDGIACVCVCVCVCVGPKGLGLVTPLGLAGNLTPLCFLPLF